VDIKTLVAENFAFASRGLELGQVLTYFVALSVYTIVDVLLETHLEKLVLISLVNSLVEHKAVAAGMGKTRIVGKSYSILVELKSYTKLHPKN
jgi:hypothetical protein